MKKKPLFESFKVPVYKDKVFLFVAKNRKKPNKFLKDSGINLRIPKLVHGAALTDPASNFYLLYFNSKSLTANLLVHEIYHIVDYIVLNHENKLSKYNMELRARLMESIFKKTLNHIDCNNNR